MNPSNVNLIFWTVWYGLIACLPQLRRGNIANWQKYCCCMKLWLIQEQQWKRWHNNRGGNYLSPTRAFCNPPPLQLPLGSWTTRCKVWGRWDRNRQFPVQDLGEIQYLYSFTATKHQVSFNSEDMGRKKAWFWTIKDRGGQREKQPRVGTSNIQPDACGFLFLTAMWKCSSNQTVPSNLT